jgi:hypothetical protein
LRKNGIEKNPRQNDVSWLFIIPLSTATIRTATEVARDAQLFSQLMIFFLLMVIGLQKNVLKRRVGKSTYVRFSRENQETGADTERG